MTINQMVMKEVKECFDTCVREYVMWLDDVEMLDCKAEYNGIVSAARIDGAEGLYKLIKDRFDEEE